MTTTHALDKPLWQPVLFGALAGGMAWGIRGQYGHETGAMIAGLLVGLALALIFVPHANCLFVARAVALCTVAIGFGGSETYGQTVGLTHNPAMVGNGSALAWGMTGLAIKGAVWIGFAGAFLGMGLGGRRYGPCEMLLVMLGALGLFALGVWVLNQPFDPANRMLPRIYFSADWYWEPDATALKPRREVWGGLLAALIGVLVYTRWRGDALAPRLGLWGVLGGALGFPLGQSVQAFHAWNRDLFRAVDPLVNWWNVMETTFGAVMGATLGLGLWLNRWRIVVARAEPPSPLLPIAGAVLLAVHIALLIGSEFDLMPRLGWYTEYGLLLGLIPAVAVTGGRLWPYLLILPITAIPIAGKTVRQLVYREPEVAVGTGWLIYVTLPLAVTTAVALAFARPASRSRDARPFLRSCLLLTTWLYFGLNFAFFRFPWPWNAWTSRTPNAIVYTICALGLTALCTFDTANRPSEPEA
ncbi:MAG: hypothetical protein U0746_09425 [Gemmataceae bacterium]